MDNSGQVHSLFCLLIYELKYHIITCKHFIYYTQLHELTDQYDNLFIPPLCQTNLYYILLIPSCARWNRITRPLSLYRFEACTHHQAGSCTQKKFWGSFKKRRIPDMTPVEFSNYTYQDIYKYIDGITLMWQRLFDGAVSLLRSCRMNVLHKHIGRLCQRNKRLPRRLTSVSGWDSLPLVPGEFPQGVCLLKDCPRRWYNTKAGHSS